jgi:hypothetical protein
MVTDRHPGTNVKANWDCVRATHHLQLPTVWPCLLTTACSLHGQLQSRLQRSACGRQNYSLLAPACHNHQARSIVLVVHRVPAAAPTLAERCQVPSRPSHVHKPTRPGTGSWPPATATELSQGCTLSNLRPARHSTPPTSTSSCPTCRQQQAQAPHAGPIPTPHRQHGCRRQNWGGRNCAHTQHVSENSQQRRRVLQCGALVGGSTVTTHQTTGSKAWLPRTATTAHCCTSQGTPHHLECV